MPCDIRGDLLACDVLEGLCRLCTTADSAIGNDGLRQSDTATERIRAGNLLSKTLHEVLACMECAQLPLHPGKDDLTSCRQGPTAITVNHGRTTIQGSKPPEKERPTHRLTGGIHSHEQGKATDTIDSAYHEKPCPVNVHPFLIDADVPLQQVISRSICHSNSSVQSPAIQ